MTLSVILAPHGLFALSLSLVLFFFVSQYVWAVRASPCVSPSVCIQEEDFDAPHVDVDAVKANLQELKGKASEHFEEMKGKATEQFEERKDEKTQFLEGCINKL